MTVKTRERGKVTLPNGVVINSAWYEHPWLTASGRLRSYDETVRRQRAARAEQERLWEDQNRVR